MSSVLHLLILLVPCLLNARVIKEDKQVDDRGLNVDIHIQISTDEDESKNKTNPPNPKKPHPPPSWLNDGKFNLFQGDIIISPEAMKQAKAAALGESAENWIADETHRWPNNEIPYKYGTFFTCAEKDLIEDAIEAMNCLLDGCFKVVPHTNQENWVSIGDGQGCSSNVGMKGWGAQPLSLQRGGCTFHATVQHEFLHAIGIWHEQSRKDRDDYIQILWDNIQDWATFNFDKEGFNTPEVQYNVDSVMHYSSNAFSKNGKETIRRKDGGQYRQNNHGVTEQDLQKIKIMYKCNGQSTPWRSCPYPCKDRSNYCTAGSSECTGSNEWHEANCMKSCDACGDGPVYSPSPRQCNDPPETNNNYQKRCDEQLKGYLGAGNELSEYATTGGCQGCEVGGIDECRRKCVDHGWCAGWTYKKSGRKCWLKTWGYSVIEDENDNDWVIGKCPEVWKATEAPYVCKDHDNRCAGYGTEGKCNVWKEWMEETCPKTCGYCGGDGAPTTETPDACKDGDDRCDGYGTAKCDVWPTWMATNCAKTCGKC